MIFEKMSIHNKIVVQELSKFIYVSPRLVRELI